MNSQPVSSAYADLFTWIPAIDSIASNDSANNANKAQARLQVQSDACFILHAFLGSTNYDNVAGDFIAEIGAAPTATRTLVSPAFVPNNFEVMIRYNSDINLMGAPVGQANLCANGYRAGNQLPYAMIFPPMTTFDFDFYNVAPTVLTLADKSTIVPLQITFGLYGYFVPVGQLADFLQSWDSYQIEAQKGLAGWVRKFTSIDFSGVST